MRSISLFNARFELKIFLLKQLLSYYRNPLTVLRKAKYFEQYRRSVHGDMPINKFKKVGDKKHWFLYAPGFPSQSFAKMIHFELNRLEKKDNHKNDLRFVFLAITNKCPLNCEHCFEGLNLNKPEVYNYNDLEQIVSGLIKKGVSQIHLSGGEPMLRVNDIVSLSKKYSSSIEFWVVTSGFNVTEMNAMRLKEAGVTGLVVSIDHFDAEVHDKFRRRSGSFEEAVNAIKNAKHNNLVTAISICATKSFISEHNLFEYAHMAFRMGVEFIQLLEPRQAGNYIDKDVMLHKSHIQTLEQFYFTIATDPTYQNYPIIVYPGYYQRKAGCFMAGQRSLYIDTKGDVMSCPFCHNKSGNVLTGNIDDCISKTKDIGCHDYSVSSL